MCAFNKRVKKHTTFKVGGQAKFIALPSCVQQVVDLLKFLRENNIRYYILGKGSNVIFRDSGFDGVIIKTANLNKVEYLDEYTVYAGAGVQLSAFCKNLQENSLKGLEFCYGIPGNVGGGLFMNAGAYGGEICQAVMEVEYIDENCIPQKIKAEDCAFSYRHSVFQGKDWVITGCTFKLEKGNK